ncbi:hypothetical protein [Paenibacillus sp. N3.4]|uniref:hypothetical protein n=1 Tax=Paenibacillus sp. N3.4 TaxID=2603222 RepID=UPI0011C7C29A|nr:hypothetical protein [Paenibacillus sp. N3.4]TXK82536.1 hypothetical protein FU659_15220 [Paenibacillus sp. N3.4]
MLKPTPTPKALLELDKTQEVQMSSMGYHVQILNAYTTFEERASALSWCKTDDLDAVAIAHALKNKKSDEIPLNRRTSAPSSCIDLSTSLGDP